MVEPSDSEAPELADLQQQMDEQAAAEAAKQAPSDAAGEAAASGPTKNRFSFLQRLPFFGKRKVKVQESESGEEARKPARIPLGAAFSEMFSALRSSDPATRKMARLFFLGLLGIILVVGVVYDRYLKYQDIRKYQSVALEQTQKNIGDFIQKQAEHAKQKFSTLSLGKFTIDMKDPPDVPKAARGVMNVAEVEITISCDSKETRYFIEDHLPQAQDQVMSVLGGLAREELLSRDGKRRLKKRIIDRINSWLPQGKIEDLYFNDLLAS